MTAPSAFQLNASPARRLHLIAMMLVAAGCASNPRIKPMLTSDDRLRELAWLAGSWANETLDGESVTISEEHWTLPSAGTMLGMNRMVVDGKMGFFEYLRIEERADGIYYLASPLGRQPPTEFKLERLLWEKTQQQPTGVVFENLKHDFPQRIIYRCTGDALHARVEGTRNGQASSEQWTWQAARIR